MKNKIRTLEVHSYAPELNKVHFTNGATLRVPGCTSLQDYRRRNQRAEPCILATISTHYPPELKWLERTYQGTVASRSNALTWARTVVAKRLTPEGKFKVRTHQTYLPKGTSK